LSSPTSTALPQLATGCLNVRAVVSGTWSYAWQYLQIDFAAGSAAVFSDAACATAAVIVLAQSAAAASGYGHLQLASNGMAAYSSGVLSATYSSVYYMGVRVQFGPPAVAPLSFRESPAAFYNFVLSVPCPAGAYSAADGLSCVSCGAGSTGTAGAGSTSAAQCLFPPPPPSPSPPPWQGAMCSFGDAHRITPNPYGNITSGTAFTASPVADTGSDATKYTLTATGGVTYDGTALAFDDTGYVSFGSAVTFGGAPFTISVWAKFMVAFTNFGRVWEFATQASQSKFLLSNANSGGCIYVLIGGVGAVVGDGTGTDVFWALGVWTHITVACTPPSTCAVYVNGAARTWAPTGLAITSTSFPYLAGFGKGSYADPLFKGSVSDFRFFNRFRVLYVVYYGRRGSLMSLRLRGV
jgi:hypothetical protein